MKAQSISKVRMAAMMGTSRTQLNRLLDPDQDVTLSTLWRAAALLGRSLRVELA